MVTLPKGQSVDSPDVRADLKKLDASLEKALPGARIASYASTGDKGFVSKDGRTLFRHLPAAEPGLPVRREPRGREGGQPRVEGRRSPPARYT